MILVDRTLPLLAELLRQFDEVQLFDHHMLDAATLVKTGCTALFFRSTLKVTAALLRDTQVVFLGSVTSGSDHIARDIAANPRYTIALASGANANAVAEYVLASVLLWCERNARLPSGLTVGIIGLGNIGRRVAWYMQQLGACVIGNDPPLVERGDVFPPGVTVASLDELLQHSTVITNHVPLTETGVHRTRRLLTTLLLRTSRAGLIIHTSRGGVIEQRALLDASRRGVAVAVDVWEHEPDVSPILVKRALLATPHIAGHSANAKFAAALMVARQYAQWKHARLELDATGFPERELLINTSDYGHILARLLARRGFLRDTDELRRMARLPRAQRCPAIEHFRATYPARYEVFRTPYDD